MSEKEKNEKWFEHYSKYGIAFIAPQAQAIVKLKYIIGFYYHRLICHLVGCNISRYGRYNMPDDWSPPSYCKRCGACDDVYQIESTDFELIYEEKTPLGLFNIWWEGRLA